jgi:hypothetical protein
MKVSSARMAEVEMGRIRWARRRSLGTKGITVGQHGKRAESAKMVICAAQTWYNFMSSSAKSFINCSSSGRDLPSLRRVSKQHCLIGIRTADIRVERAQYFTKPGGRTAGGRVSSPDGIMGRVQLDDPERQLERSFRVLSS